MKNKLDFKIETKNCPKRNRALNST